MSLLTLYNRAGGGNSPASRACWQLQPLPLLPQQLPCPPAQGQQRRAGGAGGTTFPAEIPSPLQVPKRTWKNPSGVIFPHHPWSSSPTRAIPPLGWLHEPQGVQGQKHFRIWNQWTGDRKHPKHGQLLFWGDDKLLQMRNYECPGIFPQTVQGTLHLKCSILQLCHETAAIVWVFVTRAKGCFNLSVYFTVESISCSWRERVVIFIPFDIFRPFFFRVLSFQPGI